MGGWICRERKDMVYGSKNIGSSRKRACPLIDRGSLGVGERDETGRIRDPNYVRNPIRNSRKILRVIK